MLKNLFFLVLFWINSGCNPHETKLKSISSNGERLFKTYCTTCHSQVKPTDLTKDIWGSVILPRMGNFLGIYEQDSRPSLIENNYGGRLVQQNNIYPEKPLISESDWDTLKAYILSEALDRFIDTYNRTSDLTHIFKSETSKYKYSPPSITLVSNTNNGELVIGDANTNSLSIFKNDFLVKTIEMPSPPVDFIEMENTFLVLCMGTFSPSDNPTGSLVSIAKKSGQIKTLADSLNRPVHMDLTVDASNNSPLIIISEFGKWTGKLSLFNLEKGKFNKSILDASTGPVKSYFIDLNHDGQQDILALFAQGNERITAYINKGNEGYERKDILNFSPTNGSSFMDLVDFNNDGMKDIVYCAGDNADYGPILKSNHGIYLYKNQGKLDFILDTFIPFHGAYKAILNDFDHDDDLDILGLSFFPDYTNDSSSIYYFENIDNSYQRKHFMQNETGRWMIMNALDIDNDKDLDIVLGALTLEVKSDPELTKKWIENGNGFMYLINTTNQ